MTSPRTQVRMPPPLDRIRNFSVKATHSFENEDRLLISVDGVSLC
ncbi:MULTISPECIES: hypothetical protein [unclassified Microbacterium]|nr:MULTISPECIES: hypothetical protein [unclassified Microbacterium]